MHRLCRGICSTISVLMLLKLSVHVVAVAMSASGFQDFFRSVHARLHTLWTVGDSLREIYCKATDPAVRRRDRNDTIAKCAVYVLVVAAAVGREALAVRWHRLESEPPSVRY
jgi:hypothetical protein